LILVCNTPAILSFDPFPNYRPTSIDSVERQKREIVEDNQQDDDESNERLSEKDNIELDKLRQQVDDVLQKVFVFFLFCLNLHLNVNLFFKSSLQHLINV